MGYKTIGLDINDSQLEMAEKVGADAVFNTMTNKNYAEEVKKLADGKGAVLEISRLLGRSTAFCQSTTAYSAKNPSTTNP